MRRAEARRNAKAEDILYDLHASSGAMATANSRRLRTLECEADNDEEAAAAYETARADVREDLKTLAHVTIEDNANCVRAFEECAKQAEQMHICAACGLRDLEETYTLRALSSVPDDHWLVVNKTALARLDRTAPFELLRRGEDGAFEQVTAHRRDLHNMHEENGTWYHVVPETVEQAYATKKSQNREPCIHLCSCCNQAWGHRRDVASEDGEAMDDKDGEAMDDEASEPNAEPMHIDATSDALDDLFWPGAPADSIAGGHDYGRTATLEHKHKIATDVSTLEKLVLAKVRCHLVTVQVVAPGDRKRRRLQGHTICFPHKAVKVEHSFGEAAIKAALDAVRPCFVGPNGQQGKLERAALLIDDLRLRPEVLFNFLTIDAAVHGNAPPPPIAEIKRMITECDVRARMRANASHVTSDAIVQLTKPSDIAGVRTSAQSDAQATADDEPETEEDDNTNAEEVALDMEHVGVVEFHEQDMAAVINGLDTVVRKQAPSTPPVTDAGPNGSSADANVPVDGGGSSNSAADVNRPPDAQRLEIQRDGTPLDDYMGDAEALYGAWWPLFILRRGVLPGKAIRKKKLRHLFCYYDCRFAHDMQLLFHLANTVLRHAANTAVSVTVKSKGSAFEAFRALVTDSDFLALLDAAKQNPKGPEAREIMNRIISFINLAGKSIPWGSRERAFEMTKLMAIHRSEGPGSIFYSMAPDGKCFLD